jgi:hypothetical protein
MFYIPQTIKNHQVIWHQVLPSCWGHHNATTAGWPQEASCQHPQGKGGAAWLAAVPKIEKYPCCFHKTGDCETAIFLHMTLHVYEELEQVIY